MFLKGTKKHRPRIRKNKEYSIVFPKWQVIGKSAANINCSHFKIFKVIFCLFRLSGIEVLSYSQTVDRESCNVNAGKFLKPRLMVFIQNGCKFTIYVGMSTKILLGIAMIFYKEDKTRCLTHSFAALLTILFYTSVYRRRQEMMQIANTLSQLLRKIIDGTSKVKTHLFLVYSITMQVILLNTHILRYLSENYINSNLIIISDSTNPTLYYCNELLEIFLIFASILWYIALLIFSLYYVLTCSFIRVLLEHILEQIDGDLFPEDLENLFLAYGEIMRFMRSVDEYFSQPVFFAIVFNMAGLFWGGYRIAFYSDMSKMYFLSLLMPQLSNLSNLLLIMVSASFTNELASKVKCAMQCLPYRNSIQDPQRKFNFKKDLNQENSLTLWKVYVMDRSLIITSIGTLLTYGILIGTLGKNT
ncbi:uncharacterized protein TNCT_228161 [Trichonephila clavata]|uniref:Gustatory receptor n=1 Tax=Trichonephila clavata TaxID=2740835 RepID=A0A8X6HZE5_TRICU|nr:uncharacterized protein TNCT_228161 [Trichonephila clavata]